MTDNTSLKETIRRRLRDAGFDAVGFASTAHAPDRSEALKAFVAAGYHGDMAWLADRLNVRGHPNAMWPEVRTVIAAGMNYGPGDDPLKLLSHRRRGSISVYARGTDYHDILKKRLKQVAHWLADSTDTELKVFVDTAPVMEKPLAEAAGLGWQGKHTNLVSRDWGSWLFLGVIYTPLELEPDAAETDHCGSCRNCLDVCPTNAFPGPYRLDARKCISYLTIEHKGHIPRDLRAPMGNRIYGCDDCLAVCPWNKYAKVAHEAAFVPRSELQAPVLAELAALEDLEFRAIFAGSPIKRVGRDRFVRNVLIAIGNAGETADDTLRARARDRLDDSSPLVRAMAVWACARLLPALEFERLRSKYAGAEHDPEVRAEWDGR